MSWNAPGTVARGSVKKRKPTSLYLGLAFGVALAVGIGIYGVTLLSRPKEQPKERVVVRQKTAATPEQAPVSAAAPQQSHEAKQYSEMDNSEKLKYWKDLYGNNPPENIKPIIYYLEHPPKIHFKGRESKYKIFAHPSERHIAALLSVKPGSWMLRPPQYDKQFDQDFVQSVADRIEISSDDTEDQRALKEAVIATKKEFVQRMKEGENPSDIMNSAAKELYDLGQFKHDLELEVAKVRRDPNASDDDYTLMVDAANKMLDAKGLPKLRQPSIFGRQCMLQRKLDRNLQTQNPKGGK